MVVEDPEVDVFVAKNEAKLLFFSFYRVFIVIFRHFVI